MQHVFRAGVMTVLSVLFLPLALAFFYTHAYAATDGFPCDNPRLPTEAEITSGAPRGIEACPGDFQTIAPDGGAAKQFLISRYTPGPRSSVGLSNPKVDGIMKLNPDFAIALAKMLKAAPSMSIISAYRTPEGQGSKNPQSNHIYGCAVDLGYSNTNCNSAQCQWVLRNSGAYGLQIRMKYSPEWNHIEPIAKDACRSNGPGVGTPVTATRAPSSDITNRIRQTIESFTEPSPTNQSSQEQSETQRLSSSEQPLQYFPKTTPTPSVRPQTSISSQSTGTRPLSAYERISIYATEPKTQTTAATSAPLVIVINSADVATIKSEPPQNPNATIALYDNQYQITPPAQETFTSTNLDGGLPTSIPPQQLTTYQTMLFNLETAAKQLLAYLRPFGRPDTEQEFSE